MKQLHLSNPRATTNIGLHVFVTVTVTERRWWRKRVYDAVLVRNRDMIWRMTHNGRVVPTELVEGLRASAPQRPGTVSVQAEDLKRLARSIRNGQCTHAAERLEALACHR